MADMPQTRLSTGLAAIWQRNQPQLLERLALLDQAAAANPLPQALQHEAAAIAHTLAGTLGMFGFNHGTDLARELELHLELTLTDQATLTSLTQRLRQTLYPHQNAEQ